MNMSIRKATSKTLADYKAEVLHLVRKTGLSSGAAKALVAKEREYIAEMFDERGSESEAADEILRPLNARPSGDNDANTIVLSIPLSKWISMHGSMKELCALARERMRAANGLTHPRSVIEADSRP